MSKTDEKIAEAVADALADQSASSSSANKQMLGGALLTLGAVYIGRRMVNRRVRRKLRKAQEAEQK